MPKYPTTPERCIESYLRDLRQARRSDRTIKAYRCPLKPGIRCKCTVELAAASRCIGCPLLVQFEQLQVSILSEVLA